MITPEKRLRLRERMSTLGIDERELEEHFIHGSGSGGQKINKTSTCVQLIHARTAMEIRCQKTRSQADNRYWARRELCERIETRTLDAQSHRQREIEKKRRQKYRRSRRAKAKMLDEKSRQGRKKRRRKRVDPDGPDQS